MTREEEIEKASQAFNIQVISNPWTLFKEGAKWADEHPAIIVGGGAKYLKRGYDEAVKKACEWLEENPPMRFDGMLDYVGQFKKAMKGD